MRVCTFISKLSHPLPFLFMLGWFLAGAPSSWAADNPAGGPPGDPSAPPKDKTVLPEEDDFSTTPYTHYGEFNEEENEEDELRFLQYGRFFGVSLGLGLETVDGGRANLWQGGFPLIDFKVHYWFDFNLALDLGFFTATHYFDTGDPTLGGKTEVSMFHVGVDLKYYFDTKDVAAPISFANPYVILGGGQFTKTETPEKAENKTSVNSFGATAGVGLEFALKPKKSYFEIEAKAHFVNFSDDNTSKYDAFTDNKPLGGRFYTFSGSFLFTW